MHTLESLLLNSCGAFGVETEMVGTPFCRHCLKEFQHISDFKFHHVREGINPAKVFNDDPPCAPSDHFSTLLFGLSHSINTVYSRSPENGCRIGPNTEKALTICLACREIGFSLRNLFLTRSSAVFKLAVNLNEVLKNGLNCIGAQLRPVVKFNIQSTAIR